MSPSPYPDLISSHKVRNYFCTIQSQSAEIEIEIFSLELIKLIQLLALSQTINIINVKKVTTFRINPGRKMSASYLLPSDEEVLWLHVSVYQMLGVDVFYPHQELYGYQKHRLENKRNMSTALY